MAKRLALYFGVAGFLVVVMGGTLPQVIPGTEMFFGHLLYWTCPLGLADMTSQPWWSVMLGGALQNGLLYAALGLVIGLAATGVRKIASMHRGGIAKD
jgi:hypothetical protein